MTLSNNLLSLPFIFLILLAMISSCATEETQATITLVASFPLETQTAIAVSAWDSSSKSTTQTYQTMSVNEYPNETFLVEMTRYAAETESAMTRSPTITSTPTPTGTPTPTLSSQEEDEFVFELIKNNGSCDLPCLWGIQPGITTAQEYLELLSPIEQHLLEKYWLLYPSFGDTRLDEGERHVFLDLFAHVGTGNNKNVSWLEHTVRLTQDEESGYLVINYPIYNAMKQYALNNLLSKYGIPSLVLLRSRLADEIGVEASSLDFGLTIFYEDIGVLILYRGPLVRTTPNGVVQHCFQYSEVGSIRMYLHSPEDRYHLFNIIDESLGEETGYFESLLDSKVFIDIEEATGVSVEEFHDIYKVSTDQCLYSDRDIW